MERIERILKKAALIQFFFLLLAQLFFHHFDVFPELKILTRYEGVGGDNHEKIVETFNRP
jgi:hypothetical protein